MSTPDPSQRSQRQEEFLNSWSKSKIGGRPSIGLPVRGLRGLAVIAASMAAVTGVVLGGVAAVNAVTGQDQGTSDKAALTSTNLPSQAPTTAEVPPASPTATASVTKEPKKTKTTEAQAEPVRTKTVTEKATPKASSKPKKTEKATKAEKKKAKEAAAAAEAKPGATVRKVGVIKNLVTGFCVDLPGLAATAENVIVLQNHCNPGDADNHDFETVTQADGTFLLRNIKSQWCLDVNGSGNVEPGSVVNTLSCLLGDQDNQMFKKQAQGDGFFLVHVKSGLCLDVSNEDNKQMEPNRKLTLWHCSADDDHIWTFV